MNELDNYRNNIDLLDKQIIELLAKRFEYVKLVGEYKKANNMPAFQAGRWQEVLNTRKEFANNLGISPEFIEKIWDEIHDYALDLEK